MNRSIDARSNSALSAPLESKQRQTVAARYGWQILAAGAMMLLGVALRLPTAYYTGPTDQYSFNNYIFQFVGAYSDITSLYFRDQLWLHPVPYFGYNVEYPVGMGWLIWLINFVNSNVMAYFYATAAVMIASGLLVIWLGVKFQGANMWLLALSPTLPLYIVLNWDMFSILLTVAALLLFRRNRDGWAALFLAAAVWTKFFPIVLVPLVIFDRILQRRWRDTLTISAVFGGASALINAPVALQLTENGWQLRAAWLHFFRFNQQRPREINLWNFFDSFGLSVQQINTYSALLLASGVGLLLLLLAYSRLRTPNQPYDRLIPVALAAIAWFFFINKVYSPQYSLWIAALLALLAAPPALAVAFAAVDVGYFAVSFIVLYLTVTQNPATNWFHAQVVFPSMAIREATILVIIGWAVWKLIRYPDAVPNSTLKQHS